MLRTIEKETGIKPEFKREILSTKNDLDTVFFELADEKQSYILVILYDDVAENIFGCFANETVWKGLLFDRQSFLIRNNKKTINEITKCLCKNKKRRISVEISTDGAKSDFSMTRFEDIYGSDSCFDLKISSEKSSVILPVHIEGKTAYLGTWLNPISRAELLSAIGYIFKHNKSICAVEYKNTPYSVLLDQGWRHNDYFLKLPQSISELQKTMTQKSRYNLKREKRIIEENFGELTLENIKSKDVSQNIIELFYKFKNATHHITQSDYDITKLPITDYYLLKTGNSDIRAIAVSCEQGKDVFVENHTFDISMSDYSFGKILYEMYIEALIEKGKTGLALAGGNLDYKNRYGTYCAVTWSGSVKRSSYNVLRALKIMGLGSNPLSIRRWTGRSEYIKNKLFHKKQ